MTHIIKPQRSGFRVALLIGLGLTSLVAARPAHASSDFPPALQAAIAKQFKTAKAAQCVPLCTACHETTAGGPGHLNSFGKSLEGFGLLQGSPATIDPALAALALKDPDSDGDGTNDIEELMVGDSPAFAHPDGVDMWCPDIKYGCGARIAAAPAPAVDHFGLLSAGGVVLGFAALRRRRRAQARRK